MLQLDQEFFFIHDWVDASFANDAGFGHLFHGVEFALLAMFNFPHFAEATPPNHILEMEMSFIHSYINISHIWNKRVP